MSNLNRRDFLKVLKGLGAFFGIGAIAGPTIAYFYPPKLEEMPSEPVLVCQEDELPLNSAQTVPFGRYPALVIHTDEGLKAYSAVCTHFACIIKWNPETQEIDCPCHEGYFDPKTGAVLYGPPPKGLEVLIAEVVDGQVFVKVGGGS